MAAVLCIALLVPLMAPIVSAADDPVAEVTAPTINNQMLATVFAASDFQPKVSGSSPVEPDIETGKATLNAIIDAMQADGYTNVDGALIAGDYTAISGQDNTTPSNAGLDAVYSVLTSQWPTLNENNSVFVQGNHDSNAYLTANSYLDPSGANDQSEYGVYVIHEDDFPFKSGASNDTSGAITQATAAALESYLENKVANKYGKPVFVVSHVPLHYSYRTMKSNTLDNVWAQYIFDVLNKYGKQLNIFFLFGHNHSNDYDSYVGGSAIYMTEGDKLLVPNLGSGSAFTEHTLNFTYMNTGYLGYEETDTDVGLSSTVFSIYGDRVEIKRYGYSDSHPNTVSQVNLKDTGLAGANDADCGLTGHVTDYSYASPQSVELKNFDVELQLGTLAAGVLNKGGSAQVSVFGEYGVQYIVDWSVGSAVAAVTPSADGMSATVSGVADGVTTLYANVTDPYTGSVVTLAYSFEVQTDTPSAPVSLTTASSTYTYFKKVNSLDYDGVYILVDMEQGGPEIGTHMALTYNGKVDPAREDESLQDETVPRELNAAGNEVFQLPINGTTQTLIYSTNTNAQWRFTETSKGMLIRKNVIGSNTSSDYRYLSISEGNKNYNAYDGDHDRLRMMLRSEVRNDDNTGWGTDSNYTWYYSKTYGLCSRRLTDGYQYVLYYSQPRQDFSAYRIDHNGYHIANSDASAGTVHSDEEADSRIYLFKQVTGTLGALTGYVTGVKGYVNVNVAGTAQTGDYVVITAADGTTMTVPVTVDMLSGTYDLSKPGTYPNLTVKYGKDGSGSTMTIATGYTLVVRDSVTLIKNDAAREYMDTLYTLVDEMIPGRQYLIVDSNVAGIAHAMGVEKIASSENRVYGYNVLIQSLPVNGKNILYIDSSRYGNPADATVDGLVGSGIQDQGDINAFLGTDDRDTEADLYTPAIRLVWTPTKRLFPYKDVGVEYFDVRNNNWNFIMSEMADARNWTARYLKITADAEDNQLGLFDTPATGTADRWWYQWRYGESGMHLYRSEVDHSELFYNAQNIVYAPNTSSTTDKNSDSDSVKNNPANKNFQTERDVFVDNSAEYKSGFSESASSKGDADNRRVYIYERITNIDTISARLSGKAGSVTEDRNASALTGDYILVDTTHADGTVTTEQIAITAGMLSGGSLNLEQPGTYTGITVTYQGVVLTDSYSLTVNELVVDDYPDFPDEGAVRIDKTLNTNTYNYMNTGAATIDLSVSGIPAQTGVDLVMILDTSSSMTKCLHGIEAGNDCPHDDSSATVGNKGACPIRITVLENTLETVLKQLQTPVNGYVPDIEVAVATFNGYTPINTDLELEYIKVGDATTHEIAQSASEDNWDNSQILLDFTPVKDVDPEAFNAKKATTSEGKDIATGRGTNYDRGMELAYDLIKEKQDRNAANGVTRDSVVIFMSDGMPYQYNYFHGDSNVYAWDEFVTGMLDEIQAAVNAGNGASTNISVTFGGTTLTIDKRQKETAPSYAITAAELAAYIPTDPAVKAIFDKYYNKDGKLWMAEAIKGDANTFYKIIDPDAMTADHITYVRGLNAKLYTIGFGIDSESGDGEVEETGEVVAGEQINSGSDGQYVLKNIATDPDYFHNAVDQEGLTEAFSRITQQVYSAGDAVFTDQMGAMFDMITSNQRSVGGTIGTLTFDPAPTIIVKSYETYKRSEVGQYLTFTGSNGEITTVYVTESMVGNHKPVAPTIIEVVTFNDDGTAAYSTVDVDSDGLVGQADNILEGDVIHAATFYYNTNISNARKVIINGVEVTIQTETLYWIVGDIPQDELILSYNVYLSGSMEGIRGAGSYDTNAHAELNYTNYLGNSCVQSVPTPVLPWQQATVGYGFYLVDNNGNPIINQTTGETGSFEQAVRLTQPIYQSFMFNNESGVITAETLSAAATQAGYALYDTQAAYEVTLQSNGNGTYTITAGNGKKQTTYVVGVAAKAVTGGNASGESVSTTNYATINTVVWFAVNATVSCVPDVVVIDYGLSVNIHPLANDLMMPTGTVTLEYIGTKDQFSDQRTKLEQAQNGLKYGSAQIVENGALNSADAAVQYTLGSMHMSDEETFYYAVNYTGPVGTNGLYYSSVTVIPATTIYYEDSFVEYKTYQYISDSQYPKTDTEHYRGTNAGAPLAGDLWTNVVDENLDKLQGEDRPGTFSMSYIDANNIYGFDGAYKNLATYSMGSAMKFTATSVANSGTQTIVNANGKLLENVDMTGTTTKTYGTAEFTFNGTGFDVISATSNTTGFVVIQVYAVDENGNEQLAKSTMVDTYYGYKYVDGKWVVDTEASDCLYQVPVIKISGLDYGKYRALITVSYNDAFDHNAADNASGGQYDFYLDAIRIYDPADDGNNSTVIRDAYLADGECWPEYFELRNMVISKNTFDALDSDSVSGIVFIDNTNAENYEPSVSDYINYGPNNELYLAPGQAVTFTLNVYSDANGDGVNDVAGVYLALKTVGCENGGKVYSKIHNVANQNVPYSELTTATDQYYNITILNGKTVLISNSSDSDGIVSITNIKVTYNVEHQDTGALTPSEPASMFMVSRKAVEQAKSALVYAEENLRIEKPADNPVTGDVPAMAIPMLVMFVAVLSLGALVLFRRKGLRGGAA